MDRITVQETLNLFGTFYKSKKERLNEILELINLEEKQKHTLVIFPEAKDKDWLLEFLY